MNWICLLVDAEQEVDIVRNNDDFDFCDIDRHNDDCDFDFCEDDCEYNNGYDRRRIGDYDRRNGGDCDDYDSRRRDRDCDHDDCQSHRRNRDCDCEERCGRETDRCGCHDHDDCRCHDREDGCCLENNHDNGCCERTARCSDFRDFNEDERFGCNSACDAAQSEDSWFDHREDDDCCGRTRELCEEERNFKRKLKCRIQVLDFALLETILFLDTHPCDFEALRYYRIIRKKLARLEKLYECKFGPLTNQGVDTEFGWEWATCPWPWEGKE